MKTLLSNLLIVVFSITITGCSTLLSPPQQTDSTPLPVIAKPDVTAEECLPDYICFKKEGAINLFIYINELEEAYEAAR